MHSNLFYKSTMDLRNFSRSTSQSDMNSESGNWSASSVDIGLTHGVRCKVGETSWQIGIDSEFTNQEAQDCGNRLFFDLLTTKKDKQGVTEKAFLRSQSDCNLLLGRGLLQDLKSFPMS